MLLGAADKHAYNKVMPIYNKVMDVGGKIVQQATGGEIPAALVNQMTNNLTEHVKSALKGDNPHYDELLQHATLMGMNMMHRRVGQTLAEKFGEEAGKQYLSQNLISDSNPNMSFGDDDISDISNIRSKSSV